VAGFVRRGCCSAEPAARTRRAESKHAIRFHPRPEIGHVALLHWRLRRIARCLIERPRNLPLLRADRARFVRRRHPLAQIREHLRERRTLVMRHAKGIDHSLKIQVQRNRREFGFVGLFDLTRWHLHGRA
jgi:hypothetical protein